MDNLLNTILQMLEGSEITLEIFFITLVIALPLGMLAALGRLSKLRPLSAFMEFYIWLMRGTPLMLQLLFVYAELRGVLRGNLPRGYPVGAEGAVRGREDARYELHADDAPHLPAAGHPHRPAACLE